MRCVATPCCARKPETALARLYDNGLLMASLPVLSVWPTTVMVVSLYFANVSAAVASAFCACADNAALLVAKVMFSGIVSLIWLPLRSTSTPVFANCSRSLRSW